MNCALVYVRVSSADQVNGFSLDVQERVCREFAERLGWAVALVAREEGESAKTTERRELQKVLARLSKPGHGFTHFLVYDLTRLTRETADYFALKTLLAAAGVRLVSVTQPIDDTPTGKFMGTILAAAGTFDNDLKREKTGAGMREAINRGTWPWRAPLGYLSQRGPDKRATLVHDPEKAPLVAFAFERIASGLSTQEAAREELRRRGLKVPRESFSRLIRNPIYCGRIVAVKWGIEGRLASTPIVSEDTFRKAQAALDRNPRSWIRSDLRPEFPLRWWTRCGHCGRPLTGYVGKGNGGAYSYYRCTGKHLNVSREKVHAAFAALLDSLACPPVLWRGWELTLRDEWRQRVETHGAQVEAATRRLRALEAKDEKLVSALLEGEVDGVTVKRMRAKIAAEKVEITAAAPLPLPDFKPALAAGRRIAESPRATWDALAPDVRPRFLRVAFPARLDYDPKTGFQTPAKSLYLSNLTGDSQGSCEKWYPQRDSNPRSLP